MKSSQKNLLVAGSLAILIGGGFATYAVTIGGVTPTTPSFKQVFIKENGNAENPSSVELSADGVRLPLMVGSDGILKIDGNGRTVSNKISGGEIANGAITTEKIVDESVTDKLNFEIDSITHEKIKEHTLDIDRFTAEAATKLQNIHFYALTTNCPTGTTPVKLISAINNGVATCVDAPNLNLPTSCPDGGTPVYNQALQKFECTAILLGDVANDAYWTGTTGVISNKNTTGNVGVGTSNPGYKLHIDGTFRAGLGSSSREILCKKTGLYIPESSYSTADCVACPSGFDPTYNRGTNTWYCAPGVGGVCNPPVNGVCGSSMGSCDSGYVGNDNRVTCGGNRTWTCAGANGGSDASCSLPTPACATNGVCGPANGQSYASAPTSNLCSVGSPSSVGGSGPWSWFCYSTNGGSTASCSANKTSTYSWEYGPWGPCNGSSKSRSAVCKDNLGNTVANSYCTSTVGAAETSQACSNGACSTTVIGACNAGSPTGDNNNNTCEQTRTWSCTGTNGGSNASCSYTNPACSVPVNGVCGPANGQALPSTPTNPTQLCQIGTVSGANGGVNGPWSWTCAGANGGDDVSCSATKSTYEWTYTTWGTCSNGTHSRTAICKENGIVVDGSVCQNAIGSPSLPLSETCGTNGVCNNSVALGCAPGTAINDNNITACGQQRTWQCQSTDGGLTSPTCTFDNGACATPVNGVCGSSNGGNFYSAPSSNLCSVGTATTVAGSGPRSWDCNGSNSGSNVTCTAQKRVDGACGSSNGGAFSSAPSSNLCTAGTAGSVGAFDGPWKWNCSGINGGITATCTANNIVDVSVDVSISRFGSCGWLNGTPCYADVYLSKTLYVPVYMRILFSFATEPAYGGRENDTLTFDVQIPAGTTHVSVASVTDPFNVIYDNAIITMTSGRGPVDQASVDNLLDMGIRLNWPPGMELRLTNFSTY